MCFVFEVATSLLGPRRKVSVSLRNYGTEIQRRIVMGHGRMLRSMLQEAECIARDSDEQQVVFAFQCRAGRHRSVACARLAGAYFESLGFESRVRHIGLEHDSNKCCQVFSCNECRDRPVDQHIVNRLFG